MFTFKKVKKMIGEFEADDPNEWMLLIRPQIQDVTLFTHFHKLWLVEEVKEDLENGIHGVIRIPTYEVYRGFVKDGNFVVESRQYYPARTSELANKNLNSNLEILVESGYVKHNTYYNNGKCTAPEYFEVINNVTKSLKTILRKEG